MTDTTNLREAILDAFDVVLEARENDLVAVAAEEADRIIELATAPGLRLAATVRNMLAPVSTLPSPQRLELEAALEAVERLAKGEQHGFI